MSQKKQQQLLIRVNIHLMVEKAPQQLLLRRQLLLQLEEKIFFQGKDFIIQEILKKNQRLKLKWKQKSKLKMKLVELVENLEDIDSVLINKYLFLWIFKKFNF
jgi:hypothetical protein